MFFDQNGKKPLSRQKHFFPPKRKKCIFPSKGIFPQKIHFPAKNAIFHQNHKIHFAAKNEFSRQHSKNTFFLAKTKNFVFPQKPKIIFSHQNQKSCLPAKTKIISFSRQSRKILFSSQNQKIDFPSKIKIVFSAKTKHFICCQTGKSRFPAKIENHIFPLESKVVVSRRNWISCFPPVTGNHVLLSKNINCNFRQKQKSCYPKKCKTSLDIFI